jgi:hypothetical protein
MTFFPLPGFFDGAHHQVWPFTNVVQGGGYSLRQDFKSGYAAIAVSETVSRGSEETSPLPPLASVSSSVSAPRCHGKQ